MIESPNRAHQSDCPEPKSVISVEALMRLRTAAQLESFSPQRPPLVMGKLFDQISRTLLPGMSIPEPLRLPIDVLRLLAIGYDELCWPAAFDRPPNNIRDFIVQPNTDFQDWVRNTFPGSIPATASEIVRHPSDMGDEDSLDPFHRWVASMTA